MNKEKAKASHTLGMAKAPGESMEAAKARTILRPTVQAAVTIREAAKPTFPEPGLNELVAELSDHAKLAADGNLGRMQAMLVAQSHTLDQLFHRMTRHALANAGEYPETTERYMKLALRAQAQCRANAEALQEMKHPKTVAFVQQANIANGPQQVNNGSSATVTRAGEGPIAQNKLLEQRNGEWLDGGTAGATAPGDPAVEAVASVHRAADGSR